MHTVIAGNRISCVACGLVDALGSYALMGSFMPRDSGSSDEVIRLACGGDPQALAELFARHRDQLRRMVRLRMDRRLQGRVDPSDVLQEAQLEIVRRAASYAADPKLPP